MKYYLNEKTGTLHLEGYCRFTVPAPKEYLVFNTEQDAMNSDGIYIKMCKLCQGKKEEALRKTQKNGLMGG